MALEIMSQLGLLPLRSDDIVDTFIAKYSHLDEEIRRCLPDIILSTMVC